MLPLNYCGFQSRSQQEEESKTYIVSNTPGGNNVQNNIHRHGEWSKIPVDKEEAADWYPNYYSKHSGLSTYD